MTSVENQSFGRKAILNLGRAFNKLNNNNNSLQQFIGLIQLAILIETEQQIDAS